jgi:hypothetical protein
MKHVRKIAFAVSVASGIAVGLPAGCSGAPIDDEEDPLLALCPNGGTLLGVCQGSCSYTPNGNNEAQTTLVQASCFQSFFTGSVINCVYSCSWAYNAAKFAGSCSVGTPYGTCPAYGPVTFDESFPSGSCDENTPEETMVAYCIATFGGDENGVPINGAVDTRCARDEALMGTVTKAQNGLCCSGGSGSGSGTH